MTEQLNASPRYCNQTCNLSIITFSRFVPRAVIVDLEPGVIDTIKANPIGASFRPDNYIHGRNGAGRFS